MRTSSAGIAAVLSYIVPATFVLGLLINLAAIAQEKKPSQDSGLFLVARRDLSDPLFEKSVVLMLPIPKKETQLLVGVIINKPTRIPLRDLFEDSPALKRRDAMAYFGGPVNAENGALSAIFRSAMPPKNAILVFNDVYVTFDRSTIAGLVENVEKAPLLRVVLGRAQWSPMQLKDEVAVGSWDTVRAGSDSIFTEFPEADWRVLIERAEPRPSVDGRPTAGRFDKLGS